MLNNQNQPRTGRRSVGRPHIDQPFDDILVVKCNMTILKKFKDKAKNISGKPYTQVVRDIMDALIDGRLIIKMNKKQKSYGELYK